MSDSEDASPGGGREGANLLEPGRRRAGAGVVRWQGRRRPPQSGWSSSSDDADVPAPAAACQGEREDKEQAENRRSGTGAGELDRQKAAVRRLLAASGPEHGPYVASQSEISNY